MIWRFLIFENIAAKKLIISIDAKVSTYVVKFLEVVGFKFELSSKLLINCLLGGAKKRKRKKNERQTIYIYIYIFMIFILYFF